MLRVRRSASPRRRRSRPGLDTVLATLADAAFARAGDGLLLDRPTRPADSARFVVLNTCAPLTLDLALDHASREAAHLALCHGWRAADLLAFARRRVDAPTLSYLGDVLGLTAQWSAAAGWLAELDSLGHRTWWTSGAPHATQWVQRHDLDRARTIEVAVDVLALLTHLPHTAAALPETPEASGALAGVLVRERRIVTKIDALFARAVGTSFIDEAEACAAKAQEMLLRHARPALGVVLRTTAQVPLTRSAAPLPARRPRPRPAPLAISA